MPKKKKLINSDEHKPATKGDVYELARMTNSAFQKVVTKEDAKQFLTKEDAKQFLTKEDGKNFATKKDVQEVKKDVEEIKDKQDDMQSDIEYLVRSVDKLVEAQQVSPTHQPAGKNIPQRVTKLEHDVAILKLGR